jgi:hypothetical protein
MGKESHLGMPRRRQDDNVKMDILGKGNEKMDYIFNLG